MRPNKLTRCISKTNVSNEYRIDNYATFYKLIHEIKEKYFKATNHQFTIKAKIRMRIHPADIPPKRGEIMPEVVTGDIKFGMSLKIIADSA
jgi:transposase-like protein